ncbi:hypothetical protein KQX54_013373 [Cotesia glomerata]|nr:hypothetical protein KQX54_004946 [Cotesia glomerata]KAH0567755.1 hypothetical protein KQX54_013373 [Cotesia glomerata]
MDKFTREIDFKILNERFIASEHLFVTDDWEDLSYTSHYGLLKISSQLVFLRPPIPLEVVALRICTLCEEFNSLKATFDLNGNIPNWPYWEMFFNYWTVVQNRAQ